MKEVFKWLFDIFLHPAPHEIQSLIWSTIFGALMAFFLVFVVERLRCPMIRIESADVSGDWKGRRTLWNLRVTNVRNWLKRFFAAYTVHDLKVFISIYRQNGTLQCRYQSTLIGESSFIDLGPDPLLFQGIDLTVGEIEEFCFLFRQAYDRPKSPVQEPDQYVAFAVTKWQRDQRIGSTFLREDSQYNLVLGQYVVEVLITSDQRQVIKRFLLRLEKNDIVIRRLSLMEYLMFERSVLTRRA